jgi:hypothetical protein
MKVFPKNDDIRRVMAHPTAGKFRAEGPAEWPDDSFTHRRIRDGDVTLEGGGDPQMSKEPATPSEKQPHRKNRAE